MKDCCGRWGYSWGWLLVVVLLCGCESGKPKGDLPPLHPTKGKVTRGGQGVPGGSVKFVLTPDTPETRNLVIAAELNADGSFELQTLHSVSLKKAPGAPAGTYKVTFTSAIGDQTQGGQVQVVELPNPITLKAEPNELTLEIGKK